MGEKTTCPPFVHIDLFPPLTDKPAVVTLLHHIDDVALPQLQLVLVARRVVVHGLVSALGKADCERTFTMRCTNEDQQ